jgi:DNA invertase Pin-like site-specific DNA recombinase
MLTKSQKPKPPLTGGRKMEQVTIHQPVRAAEYLRMSTDGQQLSVPIQQASIRLYAAVHSLTIVRSYADEGKSGLTTDHRAALMQLLADVEDGSADFDVILIHDVSRWGRWQDLDEAAYHEFRCRRAGKRIVYCSQEFLNDHGPITAVIKAVERSYAAKFSRDLSIRVGAAQERVTALGYLHGGGAGYGLRRMVVAPDGTKKGILERGVKKFERTDRILLVPGPAEEIAVVNRIYDMAVNKHMFIEHIARQLNRDNVPYFACRLWKHQSVRYILTNERYIGHLVFNRTLSRLRLGELNVGRIQNDRRKWLRVPLGFEPLVPLDLFAAANRPKTKRNAKYRSDAAMLDPLRELWEKNGYLSPQLIKLTKGVPSLNQLRRRFGCMQNVFDRLGYRGRRNERSAWQHLLSHRLSMEAVRQIISHSAALGIEARWKQRKRRLTFGSDKWASVGVGIHVPTRHETSPRWVVHSGHVPKPDFFLVQRLDATNTNVECYYLLPRKALGAVHTAFDKRGLLEPYRCGSLDAAVTQLVQQCAFILTPE